MEEEIFNSPYDGPMRCDKEHHMVYQGVKSHESKPDIAVQTWYCAACNTHKTLNYRYR